MAVRVGSRGGECVVFASASVEVLVPNSLVSGNVLLWVKDNDKILNQKIHNLFWLGS